MPPTDNTKSPTEKVLLQSAGTILERLVGVVSCLFGTLLFAAMCFLLHAVLTKRTGTALSTYLVLLAVGVLAALLLTAGIRLLLARPNKYGGLFAPSVWFALSAVMLCLAVFIAFTIDAANFGAGAQALISALLFALLSYGAGMHFRGKARRAA